MAEIAAGAANAAQRNEDIRTALRVQRLFQHVFLVNSQGEQVKPWMVGVSAFVVWLCDYAAPLGPDTPEQLCDLMCDMIRGAFDNAKAHK